jgi:sugar lactone lactonase YvrE
MRNAWKVAAVSLLVLSFSVNNADADGWAPNDATGELLISVTGFSGPEAVRYDPDQDLYFVSNFNGDVSGDANAFVSKVSADGRILDLKFMSGTVDAPFHGGRGMYIVGEELWVADANGIHAFNRLTGAHLKYIDFSHFEPGFLNDISEGMDGNLYVTDTGKSVLYRVANGVVSIAAETPFAANGITTNPANGKLILVPWSGAAEYVEWDPGSNRFETLGPVAGGENFDGVELVGGAIIVACQSDTSLHFMIDGIDRRVVPLAGKPADIAIDTKRMRVAVPFVGLHRVDILALGN